MASSPSCRVGTTESDARLGTTISGKWRLDCVLGVGGTATVYAATHRNGSSVAIKVLHRMLVADAEVVLRFVKEGEIGNLVEHPGIVRTLDDGVSEDGVPYSVMELLEGESLEDRLEARGAVPIHEAVSIACDVLDALAAAHRLGLVHRDVKPANVFLLRSGGVKVLDFGIARERTLTARGVETVVGSIMGTPAFMPPEQARGRWGEVGPSSDVWAVGAMLLAAVLGRSWRHGETATEALLEALLPTPPMREIAPHLPPWLAAILDRALAYRPEDRFESEGMLDALRTAMPERSSTLDPSAGGLDVKGTRALEALDLVRPLRLRVGLSMATFSLLCLAVVAFTQERRAPSVAEVFSPKPSIAAKTSTEAGEARQTSFNLPSPIGHNVDHDVAEPTPDRPRSMVVSHATPHPPQAPSGSTILSPGSYDPLGGARF